MDYFQTLAGLASGYFTPDPDASAQRAVPGHIADRERSMGAGSGARTARPTRRMSLAALRFRNASSTPATVT